MFLKISGVINVSKFFQEQLMFLFFSGALNFSEPINVSNFLEH